MRSVFATGSEYTELHRQAHDDAPPANDLPKGVSGKSADPRPIAAAMSWLKVCVIEGMAAYGVAMCVGIAGSPEQHVDHRSQSTSDRAAEGPTPSMIPYP